MTEEAKAEDTHTEEPKSRKDRMSDGIRQGVGVLSAFRDALEETIQEARERGDLSAERAKEVVKDALDRAQSAAEGARERLDFATQADMEDVKSAIDSIRARVGELEESVFGSTKGEKAAEGEGSGSDSTEDGAA